MILSRRTSDGKGGEERGGRELSKDGVCKSRRMHDVGKQKALMAPFSFLNRNGIGASSFPVVEMEEKKWVAREKGEVPAR